MLPHQAEATISRTKIQGYLLSDAHPLGQYKAAFFNQFGFRSDRWELLADALRKHALTNGVTARQDTVFGTRYTLQGPLEAPDGRQPIVRSVWFIDAGGTVPRFVTAYPIRRTG